MVLMTTSRLMTRGRPRRLLARSKAGTRENKEKVELERLPLVRRGRGERVRQRISVKEEVKSEVLGLGIQALLRDKAGQREPVMWILLEQRVLVRRRQSLVVVLSGQERREGTDF